MKKISYPQYKKLLRDPDTPKDIISQYSIIDSIEGTLTLRIRPNPDRVEMLDFEIGLDSFSEWANDWERSRRQDRFQERLRKAEWKNKPVLLAEGDSWFQFPLLVDDVIDHLEREFLIWSLSAAGDTLQNITDRDNRRTRHYEYMDELKVLEPRASGFLLSAAGNDIIGEIALPDGSVKRALQDLLKDGKGSEDAKAYVNLEVLSERLAIIKRGYLQVVDDVHSLSGFENLPIFIHGYDYVFPYPWGAEGARRSFLWSRPLGKWLGLALDGHNVRGLDLRRDVLKYLIDELYMTLEDTSSERDNVYVVDCRGALPKFDDWIDEIHGTSEGFSRAAARFASKIYDVLESRG